jgi:hypothetical protein
MGLQNRIVKMRPPVFCEHVHDLEYSTP